MTTFRVKSLLCLSETILMGLDSELCVFPALFQWRDQTARSRDDSVDFVLPKRQLLNISKAKPSTVKQLKQVLKGSALLLELREDKNEIHLNVPITSMQSSLKAIYRSRSPPFAASSMVGCLSAWVLLGQH